MGSNPIYTFMSKKYYVKRWVKLDKYYDELSKINKQLKKEPDNDELINKKLVILKRIKHFLRYYKNDYEYYKS